MLITKQCDDIGESCSANLKDKESITVTINSDDLNIICNERLDNVLEIRQRTEIRSASRHFPVIQLLKMNKFKISSVFKNLSEYLVNETNSLSLFAENSSLMKSSPSFSHNSQETVAA